MNQRQNSVKLSWQWKPWLKRCIESGRNVDDISSKKFKDEDNSKKYPPLSSHSPCEKDASKKTLLKLDIKFNFPVYDGELNAKNIDNWIHHIEFYYHVQQIIDDKVKFELVYLWLEGIVLIWWETRLREGKTLSSWFDFTSTLKKIFYPLAHNHKAII